MTPLPIHDDLDHAVQIGRRCRRGHWRPGGTNCRDCAHRVPPAWTYTHRLCGTGHLTPYRTSGCPRCQYAARRADPVRWSALVRRHVAYVSRRRAEARAEGA